MKRVRNNLPTWTVFGLIIGVAPAHGAEPTKEPVGVSAQSKILNARSPALRRLRGLSTPGARAQRRSPQPVVTAARSPERVLPAEPPCGGLSALPRRAGIDPFPVGEELSYELRVAGASLGRFEIKVGKPRMVKGRPMVSLFGRARTSSFVSSLKPFSGRYMALVDSDSHTPIGVRVESMYGEEERWEKVKFFEDRRRVEADFSLGGHEWQRSYAGDHDLVDILTLLYAGRRYDLSGGLEACQDVFAARRLWRMNATVLGVTEISTPAGPKSAYRVRTTFERKPHAQLNNSKRPKIEVEIFYAKDRGQTPLAFVVKSDGITAEAKLTRWALSQAGDDDWSL